MKTPEELGKEWASKRTYIITISDTITTIAEEAFLAGYQAAAPQWISVKDRLPEIGAARVSEDVLIINKYGEMKVSCFVTWGKEVSVEWGEAGDLLLEDFTHWMLLPAAPKEEA
jgi:hypothetical protein